MRAIIQRVKSASVTVDGKVISQIGAGLCVLIGICRDDTDKDGDWICNKILKLCLFGSPGGDDKRWSASVQSRDLEVLCVSQFTLYSTLKGNKPDFHLAMEPGKSRDMYHRLLEKLKADYRPDRVKDGEFGAMMDVAIVNDGPVTISIESPPHVREQKVNKRDLSQQMSKVPAKSSPSPNYQFVRFVDKPGGGRRLQLANPKPKPTISVPSSPEPAHSDPSSSPAGSPAADPGPDVDDLSDSSSIICLNSENEMDDEDDDDVQGGFDIPPSFLDVELEVEVATSGPNGGTKRPKVIRPLKSRPAKDKTKPKQKPFDRIQSKKGKEINRILKFGFNEQQLKALRSVNIDPQGLLHQYRESTSSSSS